MPEQPSVYTGSYQETPALEMDWLPAVDSVEDLPAFIYLPLPVQCLVPGVGLYIMKTEGEWEQVFAIDPPSTDIQEP